MQSNSDNGIQAIDLAEIKPRAHYSNAIVAGGFVYISGQTPRDATGNVVGNTIEEQTAAVLDSVIKVLAAAGAKLEDVVKSSVYLRDLALFQRFNATYARYFPVHKPARTTVASDFLDIMIEVDVVAYIGTRRGGSD